MIEKIDLERLQQIWVDNRFKGEGLGCVVKVLYLKNPEEYYLTSHSELFTSLYEITPIISYNSIYKILRKCWITDLEDFRGYIYPYEDISSLNSFCDDVNVMALNDRRAQKFIDVDFQSYADRYAPPNFSTHSVADIEYITNLILKTPYPAMWDMLPIERSSAFMKLLSNLV